MKPLEFFVPPNRWFDLVEEIAWRSSLEVVFQRYETPEHAAGYHLASLGALQSTYVDGGYRSILLSIGGVPAHDQDWEYMTRAADDLLESEGGNWKDGRLGIRSLRIVSKRSGAKAVFKEFRRALFGICKQGMMTEGTVLPHVLYVPQAGWEYMSGPEEDAVPYTPI